MIIQRRRIAKGKGEDLPNDMLDEVLAAMLGAQVYPTRMSSLNE